MINNFSFYLALRYLRPKRTFVSVITVISVLGVTLGVAALIVVISVMAGFHQQIMDLAKDYDAHIEAEDSFGSSMMGDSRRPPGTNEKSWREILKDVQAQPGVVSASPTVRGLLLIESQEGNVAPALMWGLKQEAGNRLQEKHKELIKAGSPDLKEDNIILDEGLAKAWGVTIGDKVTVYAPSNLRDIVRTIHSIDEKTDKEKEAEYKKLKELVLPLDLTVTGIFTPPRLQDSDKVPLVIVPLHVAQELRNMGDGISSIGIEVTDPYRAGEIKKQLMEKVFPDTWNAYTWVEKHQQLFDTVQNELEMMYFILFFIVIVAAFCVMNTMITVTVQKRREIGIISALGSRIGQVMWVFLIQGMIVGAFGALGGLGAGCLVVALRNWIRRKIADWTHHEIFNSEIYGLIEIPAKFVARDLTIICVGAFVLCTLAALVPAFMAARTEPAEALRD